MALRAVPKDFRRIFAEAAWHLGTTRGQAGLTVRAIADEIDVSAALLYAHFEDKAALMAELHGFAANRLGEELDHVTSGGRAIDRLVALCTAYVDFVAAHRWLYEGSRTELGAPSDLVDHQRVFTERVEPLLADAGPRLGRIGIATPAHHLWIGVHGLAQLTSSRRAGMAPSDDAAHFVASHTRLLLRGIGVADAQPSAPASGIASMSTVAATGSL